LICFLQNKENVRNVEIIKPKKDIRQDQKKDKIEPTTKFICECGVSYTQCHKALHIKTAKHTLFMESKNVNSNRESSKQPHITEDDTVSSKIEVFNDIIKKYRYTKDILQNSKDDEEKEDINIKLSGIQQEYTHKKCTLKNMISAYIIRHKISLAELPSASRGRASEEHINKKQNLKKKLKH